MSSPTPPLPARARASAAVAAGILVAGSLFVAVRLGADLGTVPIDGCYYLAKARSFAEDLTLRVPWGNGLDAKFLPGVSILFAPFVKLFGLQWGWILVEAACLAAASGLVFVLSRRLGAGPIGGAAAAAAFAVDPLVVKWASVPYAEIPATAFALAAVELAFEAREAASRRFLREVFAALTLGVAATMRLEAFAAAPILAVLAASRRPRLDAVKGLAAAGAAAAAPLALHLTVMAQLGVAPGRLHYVEEFVRNFELSKYLRNAGGFFVELAHWSPPKRNVLASMPWPLDVLQGAARIVALLLSAAGAILCLTRPAGRFALALLLTFPLVHALWHYFDGRFLLLVWPVVAILTGLGAERLVVALRGLARGVAAGVLALTGLVLLLTGLSVAHQEILRWEDVTGGSARDLARRIDEIVGADAEGLYEFENVPPPVRSGPFVAMHRRARACFAFGIPDFFAPDTPPEAGPEFLREGKRFVLTNLTFAEWAARRVPDAAGRGAYQALVEERGRTLIIVKR